MFLGAEQHLQELTRSVSALWALSSIFPRCLSPFGLTMSGPALWVLSNAAPKPY
nr:MAG TPA: hypothetical protein [Bacteriophage sp.]